MYFESVSALYYVNYSLFNTPTPGITIQSQELYRLAQYLQEALHREKMLEQKLSTLQKLVQNTQESSEGGWQVRFHIFIHVCLKGISWQNPFNSYTHPKYSLVYYGSKNSGEKLFHSTQVINHYLHTLVVFYENIFLLYAHF